MLDEVVTKFLLDTCPRRQQVSETAIQAAIMCGILASSRPPDDAEAREISLITGSFAEFYIEPMLPHVGDIDVMCYRNTHLAVPRGQSPPSRLPDEFHNYVHVMEIIDSEFPGYVYLQLYDVKSGKWLNFFIKSISNVDGDIHGPAVIYLAQLKSDTLLPCDYVLCVRCLSWPSQAVDWPTRHRNYGWPDSETVDHVVSNGCDLVRVAHRQCRQHEKMGKWQWRLSFSRAEIVLLNSWMPVQQIVYHMLRVFMKAERLTDSADNSGAGKLSNYHIKSLMLWASELKPKSWWTDDLNLVRICVQLLHILAEWLTSAQCLHYFISNCTLIDNSFNVKNISAQLMSTEQPRLSNWFFDNYIKKCAQLCPSFISRSFDIITTSGQLQNAVSAIVAWKKSMLDLWRILDALLFAENIIPAVVNQQPLTARLCACLKQELAKTDTRLPVYFTAATLLRVASGFSDELMDILATLFGHFIEKRHNCNNPTSVLSVMSQATKLMTVVANKSRNTITLIEIELSKAYLYRALRCKDSDSDSIYCLANVYVAVLYYATGQYRTAIDHCTLVTRSLDHSQCSSHVVQGELLPKIDDDIDVVLGLTVFYQHVLRTALNQEQRTPYLRVFTTELFAFYLHVKYLSISERRQFVPLSLTGEFDRYRICILDTQQLFIGDVLLFVSISRSLESWWNNDNNLARTYVQLLDIFSGWLTGLEFCQKAIRQNPRYEAMNRTERHAAYMAQLLQQSAVEHLTTFRQLEARDFDAAGTIVTTDFEAAYAYKRGDYQRCLQLSTQNVQKLLHGGCIPNVSTSAEFIQLLDGDIVSLIALTLIVNPKFRDSAKGACIDQLTLSLYLMSQCQLKLRHSMTSLAQTLDYVIVAQRRPRADRTLDLLTLKLIACTCAQTLRKQGKLYTEIKS